MQLSKVYLENMLFELEMILVESTFRNNIANKYQRTSML